MFLPFSGIKLTLCSPFIESTHGAADKRLKNGGNPSHPAAIYTSNAAKRSTNDPEGPVNLPAAIPAV